MVLTLLGNSKLQFEISFSIFLIIVLFILFFSPIILSNFAYHPLHTISRLFNRSYFSPFRARFPVFFLEALKRVAGMAFCRYDWLGATALHLEGIRLSVLWLLIEAKLYCRELIIPATKSHWIPGSSVLIRSRISGRERSIYHHLTTMRGFVKY